MRTFVITLIAAVNEILDAFQTLAESFLELVDRLDRAKFWGKLTELLDKYI